MPTLLQINTSANRGSTGKIAEQINIMAQQEGWETWIAYGRRAMPSMSGLIHVGNKAQVYEHYFEHRVFDNDGLASRIATRKLVKMMDVIKPDIIHLHNIHDHWLNYRILFEFLNNNHIPVVWTQHDCWSFTGGCFHFALRGCYRWRDGGCTNGCPIKHGMMLYELFEKTSKHYHLKQDLFSKTENMTIVPVSFWLEKLVQQSFLKQHRIITIHNGIDISVFHPIDNLEIRHKYSINEGRYILGVSSVWLPYKGWNDFLELSTKLPNGIKLVLVGLNKEQIKITKDYGIIGIPHTSNVNELVALYSGAELFVNLTYEDTYPTTNLEAMACGTPVITYRTGGSVESITANTGWIVEQGDINGVLGIAEKVCQFGKSEYSYACRKHAEEKFNKDDRFAEYMSLYKSLV